MILSQLLRKHCVYILNGLGPLYLSELLRPYIPNRNLRSSNKKTLNQTDILLCSSENYLYAIQLKGTQGAKSWPVLRLVKLKLKSSVNSNRK